MLLFGQNDIISIMLSRVLIDDKDLYPFTLPKEINHPLIFDSMYTTYPNLIQQIQDLSLEFLEYIWHKTSLFWQIQET